MRPAQKSSRYRWRSCVPGWRHDRYLADLGNHIIQHGTGSCVPDPGARTQDRVRVPSCPGPVPIGVPPQTAFELRLYYYFPSSGQKNRNRPLVWVLGLRTAVVRTGTRLPGRVPLLARGHLIHSWWTPDRRHGPQLCRPPRLDGSAMRGVGGYPKGELSGTAGEASRCLYGSGDSGDHGARP